MPRPHVFNTDTTLYHPVEGKKLFPKGETDPGPLWTEKPGGEPVGTKTSLQALHDLIEAQERIEQLEAMLERNAADLDEMSKAKDEALGKVHDLEQRAIVAEKAQKAAEELVRQHMTERDQARAELEGLKAKLVKKPA